MDAAYHRSLEQGLQSLGQTLAPEAAGRLERFAEELLRWNERVNLTAITDPAAVAEKHIVDSLSLAPLVGDAATLLDVGSGAGIPGIPLACVFPDLAVTCCEASSKKVAFIKTVSAQLGVAVKAVAVFARGEPEKEGLPLVDLAVSRAFAEPGEWVALAVRYLKDGGRVLGMLARRDDEAGLRRIGAANRVVLEDFRELVLPMSQSRRVLAVWRKG
jgi:16S rRNA (guanine527-N7)-methyltransferase